MIDRVIVRSNGFQVCREITTITLARIVGGALVLIRSARMLPRLPGVVPMETELGQNPRDSRWLFVSELNPDPFSNHFGHFKEAR